MTDHLAPFFRPTGVAIIGVSASSSKLSHGILKNLLDGAYRGKVYPVNPRYQQVLDLPCYPDIASVPDPVDLAVIVLPAPVVPETLEACGRRGIHSVIIISGGFKEVGPAGLELEERCLDIARRYEMRLVGPNCVGILDLTSGVNSTFIKGAPEPGNIAFLSQSGAVCGGVVDYVRSSGIGFANLVSLGNQADVNETDLVEYFSGDPQVQVIALYLEGIRDGRRFMRAARRVGITKPVVALKVGRSQAGARAVSSHTGSLAGSFTAYASGFAQAGVISVDSAEDLFNVSAALVHQPLPAGGRVALVTNSGGPAALASDSLAANGLDLATLSPATQAELRAVLAPSAQVANPVDMLGGAEPKEYAAALRLALADEGVDAVVVILTPQALVNPLDVAQAITEVCAVDPAKPVLTVFLGGETVQPASRFLYQHGIPAYTFPEKIGVVLGKMLHYARWKSQTQTAGPTSAEEPSTERFIPLPPNPHANWTEAALRPVLSAYGIPVVSGALAASPEAAVEIAGQLGYPVVLKISSPDVLHKTDSGGVQLNLNGPAETLSAARDLWQRIQTTHPHAAIEGILVEKMAPKGIEMIVGVKRDDVFGPLVMVGLGGVWVELLGDVAFGVAPLTRAEAIRLIANTRSAKLLNGWRGAPAADIEALADILIRLGELALAHPEVQEIEINPLLVYPQGQGALAIDARAVCQTA